MIFKEEASFAKRAPVPESAIQGFQNKRPGLLNYMYVQGNIKGLESLDNASAYPSPRARLRYRSPTRNVGKSVL